jgi:hypothetical protein
MRKKNLLRRRRGPIGRLDDLNWKARHEAKVRAQPFQRDVVELTVHVALQQRTRPAAVETKIEGISLPVALTGLWTQRKQHGC